MTIYTHAAEYDGLLNLIEKLRVELVVQAQHSALTDPYIIELSQRLDAYIVQAQQKYMSSSNR